MSKPIILRNLENVAMAAWRDIEVHRDFLVNLDIFLKCARSFTLRSGVSAVTRKRLQCSPYGRAAEKIQINVSNILADWAYRNTMPTI